MPPALLDQSKPDLTGGFRPEAVTRGFVDSDPLTWW
jgi:hypothetical protein